MTPSDPIRKIADEWQAPDHTGLTLAEIVGQEATRYRAWKTDVGDFLAGQMESLSSMIVWLKAATVADLDAGIHGRVEEARRRRDGSQE